MFREEAELFSDRFMKQHRGAWGAELTVFSCVVLVPFRTAIAKWPTFLLCEKGINGNGTVISKFEIFCDLREKKEIFFSGKQKRKERNPKALSFAETRVGHCSRGRSRARTCRGARCGGAAEWKPDANVVSTINQLSSTVKSKPDYILKIRYSTQPEVYILENEMKEITSEEFGRR